MRPEHAAKLPVRLARIHGSAVQRLKKGTDRTEHKKKGGRTRMGKWVVQSLTLKVLVSGA